MSEMIVLTLCVIAFVMALKEFWLGVACVMIASLLVAIAEEIRVYFNGED